MADDETNKKILEEALGILNQIASNYTTPKTVRKNITDMITELKENKYSISVCAANAVSTLDDITQDPNIPSHIRVTLWQAVSKLESIREQV